VSTLGELLEQLDGDDLERLAARLKPFLSGDDGWLGTKEAAAYAGCTVPALRYAMAKSEVEYEQAVENGKVYFRRSALDRWRAGR
jgi:hypothetical protein